MVTFSKALPRRAAEIEKIAREILEKFCPEKLNTILPIDAESYFEDHLEEDLGIRARYKILPEGLDGLTDAGKMRCYISESLASYEENEVQRRRFRATIAHELGHCYLHIGPARKDSRLQQVFTDVASEPEHFVDVSKLKRYEDPEWQAWRFASAFLMPEPCFRLAVERNWTIKKMKLGFDVNPSFVEVRLKELKIPKSVRRG